MIDYIRENRPNVYILGLMDKPHDHKIHDY